MKNILKRSVFVFMTLCLMLSGMVAWNVENAEASTLESGLCSPEDAVNRIHVLAFPTSTDAILLESRDAEGNPVFGLVDTAEDTDYPKGFDIRYPDRAGTTKGIGYEEQVITYLKEAGVTSSNLEFVIGTHPHSDHIGAADEIINEFQPDRVYLMEYKDEYITNDRYLWDNLYVYDCMIHAAMANQCVLIQHFSKDADVLPEEGSTTASPDFNLGSMQIEIKNYKEDYMTGTNDANDFSLGVLVTANGKRAFLSGDINNFGGDELELAEEIGRADFLKLGHHGGMGSNSAEFLQALCPEYIVQTGAYSNIINNPITYNQMKVMDVKYFCAAEYAKRYDPDCDQVTALVFGMQEDGIYCENYADQEMVYASRYYSPYAKRYKNGQEIVAEGWGASADDWYYFDRNGNPVTSQWLYTADKEKDSLTENMHWYYMKANGTMTTGWAYINNAWYYFESDGIMQTGWQKIHNIWYYFNRNGAMQTGWVLDHNTWYYLDSNGAMRIGWIYNNNKWYYMKQSGAMQVGWVLDHNTWYYMSGSGAMSMGWVYVHGNWYYLDTNGSMQTGWMRYGNKTYYLRANGSMLTGWLRYGGRWYHFRSNGSLIK